MGEVHRAMPEVTIGAVSQQLQAMLKLGLVEMRSKGQLRLYRAKPEAFGSLRAVLESMWDDSLLRLKVAAELEQARRGPRAAPKSKRKVRNQT